MKTMLEDDDLHIVFFVVDPFQSEPFELSQQMLNQQPIVLSQQQTTQSQQQIVLSQQPVGLSQEWAGQRQSPQALLLIIKKLLLSDQETIEITVIQCLLYLLKGPQGSSFSTSLLQANVAGKIL